MESKKLSELHIQAVGRPGNFASVSKLAKLVEESDIQVFWNETTSREPKMVLEDFGPYAECRPGQTEDFYGKDKVTQPKSRVGYSLPRRNPREGSEECDEYATFSYADQWTGITFNLHKSTSGYRELRCKFSSD